MKQQQTGTTLIELMVALAIGSFLIVGAVQIYNQSRQAFVVNESIGRVQETAQFTMDIIEADVRMASNWGLTSRGLAIEGRSVEGNDNPNSVTVPTDCGERWALDMALPVDGNNNTYALACDPPTTPINIVAMADSDVLTVRRATVDPTTDPLPVSSGGQGGLVDGKLYVQTTRTQGELFSNATIPAAYDPAESSTHEVIVNSYYVATDSALIPGTPALRRKTLQMNGGNLEVIDEEVAPGVENLQVQFGIDADGDNSVDFYVDPGNAIYTPGATGYVAGARAITARIWLIVRGVTIEPGIQDNRNYSPGDRDLGTPDDSFRRMQVSKTILLRNARI